MTVTGIATRNAAGYLPIDTAGDMLSIPSIDLQRATQYTLHMVFKTDTEFAGQNRMLVLPGIDLHILLRGVGPIRIESSQALGFTSPHDTALPSGDLTGYTNDALTLTLDIAVKNDVLTLTATGVKESNGATGVVTDTLAVQGFTAALSQGVLLGNRADGTRPINGYLTEFSIEAVSA